MFLNFADDLDPRKFNILTLCLQDSGISIVNALRLCRTHQWQGSPGNGGVSTLSSTTEKSEKLIRCLPFSMVIAYLREQQCMLLRDGPVEKQPSNPMWPGMDISRSSPRVSFALTSLNTIY